ncbi:PocR ligand-binding domain-containing protein [Maridesulfovibrio sp.]|uniref:PocR ligand-binding domain-containing protein n=1 Tax=Maridesulfovibrio sp. TaxID=2795000 RepID=UPI002A18CB7B|nr:PocR ligand-binding domain-containing protein [Maridesulfovibrio sp.]
MLSSLKKPQTFNSEFDTLLLKDVIEVKELQSMLEVSYTATGMPSGIIDANSGEIYAGAGWQKICLNFHRIHPKTNARCIASDTAITNKIKEGSHYAYKCGNGLWDIGIPIMCHGRHIATFFLGQFFYEDEMPEKEFFIRQAAEFGFDKDKYISALAEVPRFSREKVEATLKYNIAIVAFLSDLATKNTTLLFEIEQRKEAEQEITTLRNYLVNIIDSMPSIIIGVDPDGLVTQWNKGAEEATGLKSSDALGHPLQKILPEMTHDFHRITNAIVNQTKHKYEIITTDKSCSKVYREVTIYPLIAGQTPGAVIRVDDVTERKNFEQMIMHNEKMTSIGGLAAGMAHEINNPLAGIIGTSANIHKRIYDDTPANKAAAEKCSTRLETIRAYLNEREIPRMLDGIKTAGTRAASIVSNMLSFARKSEGVFSPWQLGELLDRTVELAGNDYNPQNKHDFKQIKIEKNYQPGMRPVFCAGNEIQQVLLNIFKNGAQAMAEKEYTDSQPTFTCSTYEQGEMAVMEIMDNGPGIDESTRRRIFEPFFTTKEVGHGTGLGLSISYFIITDQHNGQLDVDSEPGQGTRFTIKLPFERQR